MVNAKQKSLEVINTLPDNSSFEDIIYNIYIQYKVALSLDDIKHGRVISHEDLRKEVETWK